MSDPARAGTPVVCERNAVPALAVGFSLILHGVILATGPPSTVRPRLIAARNVLAVSIERTERPPERIRETRESAPRPNAAAEIARAAAPEPEAPSRPEPPRLERAEEGAPPSPSKPRRVSRFSSAESPGGVRAARLISGDARPHYPEACRAGAHRPGGCEGRGAYEVEIDEAGRVLSVATAESAGCPQLDASASLFFLRRAGFAPAEIDGLPVPWKGRVPVEYELEGDRPRR